jgi:photosystem II stability/assembly factor-like uncharacterized protein
MRLLLAFLFFLLAAVPLAAQNSALPPAANAYFAPAPWRCIGPFRGGRSVAACGVPGDPLTYYMGSTGGGLWKTSDAGGTWANISDGYFRAGSVGAVAVAPSDPNVVYAGTGEHAPRGVMTSYGDGVYRSTDAGKTWVKCGLDLSRHISAIRVHPSNPQLVYVAAQGALHGPSQERGVYRSEDGGRSWRRLLFVDENTGCTDLSMDPSNPRILFAAMWDHRRLPWEVRSGGPGSGLYRSADGGETWARLEKGLPDELGKIGVCVSPANPDRVYALIESDSEQEQGGVFASSDGGKSWARVSKDHRTVQRAWYYIEIFADPLDENTLYVLNAPMLKSIDGGKSWTLITGTHGDYHDLWINPANSRNMVVANDGGAAITFNGGKSWTPQNEMPTAQFYRVAADNLFPYHLYGGQQDNSSVRIQSRHTGGYGIGEKQWAASAGGESAFLAFDPDSPRYVMGGSYQGTIELLDQETGESFSVMQSPDQNLARAPRDMRYRFNWNAPILCSAHEPETFFHAANVIFRTRNRGKSWDIISPDLTRDDSSRQGKSGVPYTNEGAGGENYGTIAYLAESPSEPGQLWAASDDGLLHLTRDGGKTWVNITPAGLPECLINAVELSPHDPGTAYIAATRYKFNDFAPMLYKTRDYGKSWSNISAGIPYGAYTRVLREDPVRRDLLFAGTETGLYISFDGGKQWQAFQLNLPITPITDLKIHQGDLLAATMGRSFWIFDDLGLLRQWGNSEKYKLYAPEDCYRVSGGSALDGTYDPEAAPEWGSAGGVNPPTGAVIYYHLPAALPADSLLRLEIRDAAGQLVRAFSSGKGDPQAGKLPAPKPGLNRFVWNLRGPDMPEVPEVYIEGNYSGHKVPPGLYSLSLRAGGQEQRAELRVLPDPRIAASPADYEAQHRFLAAIEADVRDIHESVMQLRKMRAQLNALLDLLGKDPARTKLAEAARSLGSRLEAWEEKAIQPRSQAYDDVINFENKLSANLLFLHGDASSNSPWLTAGQQARYAELKREWEALKAERERLLHEETPAFNRLCQEAGLGVLAE